MPRPSCSVCGAPANVRAMVDAALAQKTKLRDIAKVAGLSKSSLQRHSQRCIPRQDLASYRTKLSPHGDWIVLWPGDEAIPADEINEHTIIFRVEYENLDIRNPEGLLYQGGWTSESQNVFLARCKQAVQLSYIESQHEAALIENAERTKQDPEHRSE